MKMSTGLYKKALFGFGKEKDAPWTERDRAVQNAKDNIHLIDDPRSWVRKDAIEFLDDPDITNKEAIRRAKELEEAVNVVGKLDSKDLANMFIDRGRFSEAYRLALDYYGRSHSYTYDQNVPGEDVRQEISRRGYRVPDSYYTEEEKDQIAQEEEKQRKADEARQKILIAKMTEELNPKQPAYKPATKKQEKVLAAEEQKPVQRTQETKVTQVEAPPVPVDKVDQPATKKEEPAEKKDDKPNVPRPKSFWGKNQDTLAALGTGAVSGLTTYGMLGFMPSLARRRLLRAMIGLTVGTGVGAGTYMLLNRDEKKS